MFRTIGLFPLNKHAIDAKLNANKVHVNKSASYQRIQNATSNIYSQQDPSNDSSKVPSENDERNRNSIASSLQQLSLNAEEEFILESSMEVENACEGQEVLAVVLCKQLYHKFYAFQSLKF